MNYYNVKFLDMSKNLLFVVKIKVCGPVQNFTSTGILVNTTIGIELTN